MNDPIKSNKDLDRQAFIKAGKERGKPTAKWDKNSFEGKALKGLQNLDSDADIDLLLKDIDQKIDERFPVAKSIRLWPSLAIAASVLILVVASFFFFSQNGSPEKLAIQYFEPFPNALSIQTRGTAEEAENTLATALQLYQQGAYDAAIPYFEKYGEEQPEDIAPQLYHGLSMMGLGQYEPSIPYFNAVKAAEKLKPEFRNAAQWYKALAYLGLAQVSDAKLILEDLASRENYFQKKSKNLLELI